MALTPEDVVNKRFQPTKFREGYDQDEVDDFLDEVVVELRRLNQENEDLKQRLATAESRAAEGQRAPQPAAAESAPATAAYPAPVPAPTAAPAAPAPAYSGDSFDPSNTNNLLQLARRLHEEHVREGAQKRDSLIAEGHATAARLVSEAEAKGRQRMVALDEERAALEHRIDELRTFEREYRQKLRGYIESQLKELDQSHMISAGTAALPAGSGSNSDGSSSSRSTGAPTPVPAAASEGEASVEEQSTASSGEYVGSSSSTPSASTPPGSTPPASTPPASYPGFAGGN